MKTVVSVSALVMALAFTAPAVAGTGGNGAPPTMKSSCEKAKIEVGRPKSRSAALPCRQLAIACSATRGVGFGRRLFLIGRLVGMHEKTGIVCEVTNVEKAELAQTIRWVLEDYKEDGLSPPPLPENVLDLVPCDFNVIETYGANGLTTGKVLITDLDGEPLFEKEWMVPTTS